MQTHKQPHPNLYVYTHCFLENEHKSLAMLDKGFVTILITNSSILFLILIYIYIYKHFNIKIFIATFYSLSFRCFYFDKYLYMVKLSGVFLKVSLLHILSIPAALESTDSHHILLFQHGAHLQCSK